MAQKISTKEDLEALLESLGTTSGEVAEALVRAGIKGRREEARCCPVANWLKREVDSSYVVVDVFKVSVGWPGEDCKFLSVIPPLGVNHFVGDFDHHKYPELDERPLRRSWPDDFD